MIRLAICVFAVMAGCQAALAVNLEETWSSYLERQSGDTSTVRRYPFDTCFTASSTRHGIPKTLLLAIARGESNFDAAAVSEADAVGVMQIRWPLTARHLNITYREQLFDPCVNIDAGTRYMVELLDRFDGSLHTALVAYNRGPTRVAAILEEHAGLPAEDTWYSQYIHDHLSSILRGEERQATVDSVASDVVVSSLFTIIRFDNPIRARSMVEFLKRTAPAHRFEWRKHDLKFHVNVLFDSQEELQATKGVLRLLGILP